MLIACHSPTKLTCPTCNKPLHVLTWREYLKDAILHKGIDPDSPVEQETLVYYQSPEGHNHNDNCLTRTYVCENKHNLIVSKQQKCPACDWQGKTTCFCHPGPKVTNWP